MGQQISVEAALPVFRQRCGELADENLLLRAQINELEARATQLEEELALLRPPESFVQPSEQALSDPSDVHI
jgi:prefoldin subunit 5